MSGNVHNPADLIPITADVEALLAYMLTVQANVTVVRSMVLGEGVFEETGGTITTDGTEQTVYYRELPARTQNLLGLLIDFTNHTAGETVVVREYYRIKPGGNYIRQDAVTYAGVPANPLIKITPEPNRYGFRITIEKTGGANRDYDWEIFYEA